MSQPEIITVKPRELPRRPLPAPEARCVNPDCKLCAGALYAVVAPPAAPTDKPPGMTLAEAIEQLRHGKRIIHADWEPWRYIENTPGGFIDEDGAAAEISITRTLENPPRDWYIYAGPVPDPAHAITVQEALDVIEAAMRDDIELAWGWHCNIAMAIYDCGGRSHAACNKGAARFLSLLFPAVDTTKHPTYGTTQWRPDQTTDLTTVEALQALIDGKRVQQTVPAKGSVWWLKDGFYRSSAGHVSENLTLTASDLTTGRYDIVP